MNKKLKALLILVTVLFISVSSNNSELATTSDDSLYAGIFEEIFI